MISGLSGLQVGSDDYQQSLSWQPHSLGYLRKPRASLPKPLNDVDNSYDEIRGALEDAFRERGVNYQNRAVVKPLTKALLIALVQAQYGLRMNVRQATEAIVYSKLVSDQQLTDQSQIAARRGSETKPKSILKSPSPVAQ